MSPKYNIYKFDGFLVDEEESQIYWNNTSLKLEGKPFQVLLKLLNNAGELVETSKLIEEVWEETFVEEGNLTVAITKIRKVLNDDPKKPKFIENYPRKGYKFIAEVIVSAKEKQSTLTFIDKEKKVSVKEELINNSEETQTNYFFNSQHYLFKSITSILYGLLFGIVLILESSYKIESYAPIIYWQALGFSFLNAGVCYLALVWILKSHITKRRIYLLFSFIFLCIGCFISYVIASQILPDVPITKTNFQPQTALAAFLKNEFYILFFAMFFVLIPFFIVVSREFIGNNLKLAVISLLSFLLMIFSYHVPSTFHLTDNLIPSNNQGLFVQFLFLRSFLFFAMSIGSLAWMFFQIKDRIDNQVNFTLSNLFLILLIGLSGFLVFLTTKYNNQTPEFFSIEIIKKKDEKNEFFVNIKGRKIIPENVVIRVIDFVGTGCMPSNPCTIDNGALKKHSKISESEILNVPVTLPHGEFYFYLQNGESTPLSNPVKLTVP